MKTWENAEVKELNINETAHNWCGNSWDGGYIGDGILSGHLEHKGDNNNAESLS